jgi:hypothetical protein
VLGALEDRAEHAEHGGVHDAGWAAGRRLDRRAGEQPLRARRERLLRGRKEHHGRVRGEKRILAGVVDRVAIRVRRAREHRDRGEGQQDGERAQGRVGLHVVGWASRA